MIKKDRQPSTVLKYPITTGDKPIIIEDKPEILENNLAPSFKSQKSASTERTVTSLIAAVKPVSNLKMVKKQHP